MTCRRWLLSVLPPAGILALCYALFVSQAAGQPGRAGSTSRRRAKIPWRVGARRPAATLGGAPGLSRGRHQASQFGSAHHAGQLQLRPT